MKRFVNQKCRCWDCHWETSASEHNLHQTPPLSSEQTRKRRWVTKHANRSLQVSPWRNASNYPGAQLGLGSELVDWYRDATSFTFCPLLIDLSPRADDRLRHCTNSGSVPSKFYIPDRLKHLRHWTTNTQNLSSLQVFQLVSRKCKGHFLQSCLKEFIRFLC